MRGITAREYGSPEVLRLEDLHKPRRLIAMPRGAKGVAVSFLP